MDGTLMSAVSWKPNGEKCPVTHIENGEGQRVWYDIEDGFPLGLYSLKEGQETRVPIHKWPAWLQEMLDEIN